MTGPMLGLLAVAWVVVARLRRPAATSRRPGDPRRRLPPLETPASPRGRGRTLPGWVVGGALAVAVTVVVGPAAGGAVLALPPLVRWRRARRRRRDAESAVIDEVPEVVELLTLALGAGLTVTESLGAVGRWAPGPVGRALVDARTEIGHGAPVGDALDGARNRCGSAAAGLFAALVASDRYGVPLGPSLDRLGHQARLDRRRAAEERARRVPVQLLFPLVVCVLPAFGLLTVVPLLVNSLGALAG